MGRGAALFMNINAAKGLYDVMKTNLGPKGTIKMLVGGAGGAYEILFLFKVQRGTPSKICLFPPVENKQILVLITCRQTCLQYFSLISLILNLTCRYQTHQRWQRSPS